MARAQMSDKYVKQISKSAAEKKRIIGKNTINYAAILDTLTDKGNGMAKSFAENNNKKQLTNT